MNNRRLVCVLLGVWISALLTLTLVQQLNLRLADQLIASPMVGGAHKAIQQFGRAPAGWMLHYQAGELNRSLLEGWGFVEILISLTVFAILLFGTSVGRVHLSIAALLFFIAAGVHFLVTPTIVGVGRGLEFTLPDALPPQWNQLRTFTGTYSIFVALRVVLLAVLTALMVSWRGKKVSRGSAVDLDEIEDPNHRHVNR